MSMTANEQMHDNLTVSLGFWIYLMTDCLLFASLFATYAVLTGGTAGSVSGRQIFDIGFVLTETILLLTSSMTSGLAYVEARAGRRNRSLVYLAITIALGASFLVMELSEFSHLVSEGYGWQVSAFLSAFFTLVGTHGLHIASGLIWALTLVVLIMKRGLTHDTTKKLMLFTLFWHFLDVIWICIFTFVYAFGVLS
ncbi:MAG: cytochrome o ubiquinol oxidase subunit III [Candidatus Saccharimonadales bacterium]|jgi:cytochrome o ubiquinol oxidase subunit III